MESENEDNEKGYDDNTFNERLSVNLFEKRLLETRLIMPNVSINDRTPNYDGEIAILSEGKNKKIIDFMMKVQIKKLPKRYISHGSSHDYKYSCDAGIFKSVTRNETGMATILIMVDIYESKIFYKYLSLEYCIGLNIGKTKHKTIYFDKDDEITNVREWVQYLREIREDIMVKSQKLNNNKVVILGEYGDKQKYDIANIAFEYLNNVMDYAIPFVKTTLYPETEKFGIACITNQSNEIEFHIYSIKQNDDIGYIREFDSNLDNLYRTYGYSKDINSDDEKKKLAIELINDIIEKMVEEFLNNEENYLELLPTLALEEILYENIDSSYRIDELDDVKTGDIVKYYYPSTGIKIDEINKHIHETSEHDINKVLSILKTRNLAVIKRPWSVSYNYRVEDIDHGYSLSPVDKTREEMELKDRELFLKNIEQFCDKIHELVGTPEKLFSSKCYHIFLNSRVDCAIITADESSKLHVEYIKLDDEEFKEERKIMLIKHVRPYIEIVFRPDCSWVSFWKKYVEYSIHEYIHRLNNSSADDAFIAALLGR